MNDNFKRQQQLRYVLGYVAVALCCYSIISKSNSLQVVIIALFLFAACIFDTHKQRIPNYLVLALILIGLYINTINAGWTGLTFSLKGLSLGLLLLLPFYLLGGFGAGDVKALAALGALIGPTDIFHSFIFIGLYGGVTAMLYILVHIFFKPEDKHIDSTEATVETSSSQHKAHLSVIKVSRFPFAPSIAFGYFTYVAYSPLFETKFLFFK